MNTITVVISASPFSVLYNILTLHRMPIMLKMDLSGLSNNVENRMEVILIEVFKIFMVFIS